MAGGQGRDPASGQVAQRFPGHLGGRPVPAGDAEGRGWIVRFRYPDRLREETYAQGPA